MVQQQHGPLRSPVVARLVAIVPSAEHELDLPLALPDVDIRQREEVVVGGAQRPVDVPPVRTRREPRVLLLASRAQIRPERSGVARARSRPVLLVDALAATAAVPRAVKPLYGQGELGGCIGAGMNARVPRARHERDVPARHDHLLRRARAGDEVVREVVMAPSRVGEGLVPQEEPCGPALLLVPLHRHLDLIVVVGDLEPVEGPRVRGERHVVPRLALRGGGDEIYPSRARVKPELRGHVVVIAPLRRHVRVVRVGFARARPRRLVARAGNVGRGRGRGRRRALRRDGGSRFVERERSGAPREHRPELVGRDAVAVSGDAKVDALGGVVRVRPVPLAHRQPHRAPRRARHLSKVPSLCVAGRVSTVIARVVEHAVDVGVPVELLELEREVVPVGRRGGGHVVALPSGGLEAVALRFVRANRLRGEADHRNLAQPAGPPGRARGGAWILARTRGVGV